MPIIRANAGVITQINVFTGLAFTFSTGTTKGFEAPPLVVGDTMYVTTSSGRKYVFALNAKDGSVK